MGKWKTVRLKECFTLSSGRFLPSKKRVNGCYSVFGGNGITGKHNEYFIENPTIVIGRVGEYCGCVHTTCEKVWVTDNALYVTNFLKAIDRDYICYALNQKNLNSYANKSGQPSISQSTILKIEIPLPSLEIQGQIAKNLDTAAELLGMYKQQLAELDNLIKSIFYDMFGDPVTNEKGWEVKRLRNLSSLITKGSSPAWQGINYTNDLTQVLFITSENVREGYLDLTKRKYLENKFNELQSRSVLEYGDLLINIVGASIGRAAVYYSKDIANINQAVALVRCKKNECLIYLCHYLNSPKALQMYGEMKVDVARANLSLKNIGDLNVIYPPLPLQNQFASIVAKIEEQKTLVKKAIDETQYLFDCLMSEYFE